jgi:hypothetical protein
MILSEILCIQWLKSTRTLATFKNDASLFLKSLAFREMYYLKSAAKMPLKFRPLEMGEQRFRPLHHRAATFGYFILFLQLQAVKIGRNESRNTPQINIIIWLIAT